jgi:hypothetical protein
MTLKTGLALAAVTTLGSWAYAADDVSVRYDTDRDRTYVAEHNDGDWRAYRQNEFTIGVFGTGSVGENTVKHPSLNRVNRDGELGLGIDVQYFFHRYLGVQVDGYTESTHHNWVDNIDADLVARFPLANSGVALYAMGGGGRQLDPVYQWTLNAGGGVEWRFTRNVGVFVDARYVWADETKDYGLGRLGLRFGF